MKRIGISNSNAFILVYSIDDPESFEEVRRLRELIYEIKLEKHIAKYTTSTPANKQQTPPQTTIKTDNTFAKTERQPPASLVNNSNSFTRPNLVQKTNSISPPVKQNSLKLGEQRRHSLNNQMNGRIYPNGRLLNGAPNGKLISQLASLNGHQQLNEQLNHINNQMNCNPPNNQINDRKASLNNQSNMQSNPNSQTKRRHHHHKHPENKKSNTKPYVLTNINQRYKLSENLKLISERRKSLTNSAKIGELKLKLGNISENSNDSATQQTTADIFCLRPLNSNPLLANSLPPQHAQLTEKISGTANDMDAEEYKKCSRGRRRSSFLLSPDSCSSCSSDSECESSNCESGCSSKSSSCTSLNDLKDLKDLNSKLDQHKQDKENKIVNHLDHQGEFEHINNLNNYKSKLESRKEQERLLSDDMPPFEAPVIVVVGNKCDLECKRAVGRELAENIVQIDWDNGFIECSAKNNEQMTSIFKEMLVQSKLPFVVSNALDSQKNRRRSLPAYPSSLHHLKEPNFRTKRNSCALS